MNRRILSACLLLALCVANFSLFAESMHQHNHGMHGHSMAAQMSEDNRTLVHFPEQMRIHTLTNMRDHLLALSEIQEAMSKDEYEKAADIAENRLGMSSLKLHGAHEVGQFMPQAMANIGTQMHKAASRFAVASNNAAVSGTNREALFALSEVTKQCVACHSGYRIQ